MNDLTEREEYLINMAIEKALLILPDVLERLISQKTISMKSSVKFFQDNKEFVGHMDFVQKIVERTMLDNPGLSDEQIYQKAAPLIKQNLQTINNTDMKVISKPETLEYKGNHGAL
jgi:hypothetical protein